MRKISLLLLLVLFLNSCHKDDDSPIEDSTPERTVLVYMAAENNLATFADNDLNEIRLGSKSLTDKQQLIAYIDRAGTTPPFFARIKDGQYVDSVSVEESLTADPAILEKAMNYMHTNYPAKSYGLVLWGHASGWLVSKDSVAYAQSRAYGGDTGNGSSSSSGNYWMNIPSMARAIQNGMASIPLTFIMGDCCSFGCVEIAYELRNITEYVIGSPAEIPDEGAPYDLIVPDLFSSSADFYKSVIDHYYNYYLDMYKNQGNPPRYYNLAYGDLEGYSVPLLSIKTSELEALATKTAELLSTIKDKLGPEGSFNFTNKMCYAQYGNYRYSYDMFNILKSNTAESDFNLWSATFWNAIPYHFNSLCWYSPYTQLPNDMKSFDGQADDCGVLSMFIPNTKYRNTSPNWNKTIQQFQWNNVIQWQQYGW